MASSWIDEAYERWLARLDSAAGFTHVAKTSGQTDITLMGTTQSGKTLLALHLLGAADPQGMGGALRGGRLQGQSATPGPIAYRTAPPALAVDGPALKARVREIYEDYLAGHQRAKSDGLPDPPVVAIPSTVHPLPLTIVDMAGFDGRESWAEQAADYWTARADFTLLVTRAEKVSGITGPDFEGILPRLVNRWRNVESALVVTTFSFELDAEGSPEDRSWEEIRQERTQEILEVLAGRGLDPSRVEVYPVSFTDDEPARTLSLQSLEALKTRLQVPHTLNRLANAEVLQKERKLTLEQRLAEIRKKVAEREVERSRLHARATDIVTFQKKLDGFRGPKIQFPDFDIPDTAGSEEHHELLRSLVPRQMWEFGRKVLEQQRSQIMKAIGNLRPELKALALEDPPRISLEAPGVIDLAPRFGDPIDESFKVKMLFFYRNGPSAEALFEALDERWQRIKIQLGTSAGEYEARTRTHLGRLARALQTSLDALRSRAKEQDKALLELEDQGRDALNRMLSLPRIPDLVAELAGAFKRQWNETVSKAEEAEGPESLALAFIELWGMHQALDGVRAHVDRRGLN